MANQAQQSPESRLRDAGFTKQLDWWVLPGGDRVVTLDAAIDMLDAGEVPAIWTSKGGGVHVESGAAEHARIVEERIRQAEEERTRPPSPPPWLLAQAEVIAQVTVEKMRSLIRAEVRAALKAETRKRAAEAEA